MAVYEYAESFTNLLQEKYAKHLCSDALTKSNLQITFLRSEERRVGKECRYVV